MYSAAHIYDVDEFFISIAIFLQETIVEIYFEFVGVGEFVN